MTDVPQAPPPLSDAYQSPVPPPPPPPSAYQSPAPPPPPHGYHQQGYGYGYAPTYQLASKWKRFGAFLLDGLLVIVTLFIGWLIWYVVMWGKGQSPAKQVLKMRVLKLETGRAATFGEMAMRELVGKLVLGIIPFYSLVSGIFVLADERSQALWDKVAGTVVIDDPDERFAPN
jgi:uncharacterized RDD family membrane protein YckC